MIDKESLPAPSRPKIRIRRSLLPNHLENKLINPPEMKREMNFSLIDDFCLAKIYPFMYY